MKPRVVYSTNELLFATNQNVLPALQKSNVIYRISCNSDSRYVGRTSQSLQDRIKQLVSKFIRSCSFLFPTNAYFQLVGANLPSRLIPSLFLLIQPLDFIFYKILSVVNIMMTVGSLFLPKAVMLFKPYLCFLSHFYQNSYPVPSDKKNSLMTLSHWSFSRQSRLGFFL